MTNMVALLVRLVLSMAVVMGVMWGAAQLLKRRQGKFAQVPSMGAGRKSPRRPKQEAPFDIVYRKPLGKGACVALVEAPGRRLLIGVTEQSVTLLGELPSQRVPDLSAVAEEPIGDAGMAALDGADRPDTAWKLVLDSLRERTVRR
ncbi:MAG TPA: flagellar biosynthetic protein FliO [Acidimicrobiales bacterium]|nr:flagellar biosynthetic protein FliO [Acidimicrobiales bacterium]